MSEQNQNRNDTEISSNQKRRNVILGLVLAAAAVIMYVSIFFRLSGNPLQ